MLNSKRALCLFLVLVTLLSSSLVLADSNDIFFENISAEEHGKDYHTPEKQAKIKEKNKLVDNYIENLNMLRSATGRRNLRVRLVQQRETYYCGPASAYMVIDYIDGDSPSQRNLAKSLGTTTSGTYVYRMRDELERYNRDYDYYHVDDVNFNRYVRYSIDDDGPVVAHVLVNRLPNSTSGSSSGHYVVIKGYDYGWGGSTSHDEVTYNDPNWNDAYYGTYTCDISVMERAVRAHKKSGYFISL
ncbi:MAG: C39 family peptidase [Tissierellaceae bacterium]